MLCDSRAVCDSSANSDGTDVYCRTDADGMVASCNLS